MRTRVWALVATACLAVTFAWAVEGGARTSVVRAGTKTGESAQQDAACVRCHAGIVASYARTPMARASGLAAEGVLTGGFLHRPSGVRYDVEMRNGESTLSYERVAAGSGPALKGELTLRYFIGSNTRGRTYLFEKEGLWFETPINWYSKRGVWDMAPAYETTRTMPLTMPVDANCLHCHATGVAVTEGARNRFAGGAVRAGWDRVLLVSR